MEKFSQSYVISSELVNELQKIPKTQLCALISASEQPNTILSYICLPDKFLEELKIDVNFLDFFVYPGITICGFYLKFLEYSEVIHTSVVNLIKNCEFTQKFEKSLIFFTDLSINFQTPSFEIDIISDNTKGLLSIEEKEKCLLFLKEYFLILSNVNFSLSESKNQEINFVQKNCSFLELAFPKQEKKLFFSVKEEIKDKGPISEKMKQIKTQAKKTFEELSAQRQYGKLFPCEFNFFFGNNERNGLTMELLKENKKSVSVDCVSLTSFKNFEENQKGILKSHIEKMNTLANFAVTSRVEKNFIVSVYNTKDVLPFLCWFVDLEIDKICLEYFEKCNNNKKEMIDFHNLSKSKPTIRYSDRFEILFLSIVYLKK